MEQRRQKYPDIHADREAGLGVTELSKKYGLSRQRIYRILAKYDRESICAHTWVKTKGITHRRVIYRDVCEKCGVIKLDSFKEQRKDNSPSPQRGMVRSSPTGQKRRLKREKKGSRGSNGTGNGKERGSP